MLQPGNNGTGPDLSNHLCQKHSPKRACVNSVKHAGTQKYDRGWKGPCLPGRPHLIAVLQETVHILVNHTICFDTPRRRHDPATRSGLILPDWGAQRGENSIQSRTVGGTKETEGKFRAPGASIQSRTVGQRERRGEGGGWGGYCWQKSGRDCKSPEAMRIYWQQTRKKEREAGREMHKGAGAPLLAVWGLTIPAKRTL